MTGDGAKLLGRGRIAGFRGGIEDAIAAAAAGAVGTAAGIGSKRVRGSVITLLFGIHLCIATVARDEAAVHALVGKGGIKGRGIALLKWRRDDAVAADDTFALAITRTTVEGQGVAVIAFLRGSVEGAVAAGWGGVGGTRWGEAGGCHMEREGRRREHDVDIAFVFHVHLTDAMRIVAPGIRSIEVDVAGGVGTVDTAIGVIVEEVTALRPIPWLYEIAVVVRCAGVCSGTRDSNAATTEAGEVGAAALTLAVLGALGSARSCLLGTASTHANSVGLTTVGIGLAEVISGPIMHTAGSHEALEVGAGGETT